MSTANRTGERSGWFGRGVELAKDAGWKVTTLAVAGSIALSACGDKDVSATPTPTEATPTVTETIATPEPTETLSPFEDPDFIPENLEQYEEMSTEEYLALPVENRLEYASWITRDRRFIYDTWYAVTQNPNDLVLPNFTASLENSDNEVLMVDSYNSRQPYLTHWYTPDDKDSNPKELTDDQATKVMGAYVYNPNAEGAEVYDAQLQNLQETRNFYVAMLAANGLYAAEATSSVSGTVTDAQGNKLTARYIEGSVTNPETGAVNKISPTGGVLFVFVEYTDYSDSLEGRQNHTWVSYSTNRADLDTN